MNQDNHNTQHSPFEVFWIFLILGCTSFGGPVAHIGYFQKTFVEQKQWLTPNQYAQLLALCQFLPGPASSQLGFAIGKQRAGIFGAICAFVGFTLPSIVLMFMFASSLPLLDNQFAQAAISGLKILAVAVVADAVLGMGRNFCQTQKQQTIGFFACIFVLLFTISLGQIAVILIAAIIGYRWLQTEHNQPSVAFRLVFHKLPMALFVLLLFALPLISHLSPSLNIADTFYRAGTLVFGGGHVVLPLLEPNVVASDLLNEQQFLAGYGAAQAIPGPMFTFATYLGAILPFNLSPITMALIATFAIFLPGFLLLLAFLPVWQQLSEHSAWRGSIAGVNAAVVGILAAALYDPVFTSAINSALDIAIAIAALWLIRIQKRSPLIALLCCIGLKMIFLFV